jgi:hypothetical protein
MRLKFVAATFAAFGTLALLAVPANAQSSERRITTNARGHTVFTSRDENGRTRTKVIIQKRSYLDPGTEVLPGTEHNHDYQSSPNQRASSVLDNTAFGGNRTALPGAMEPGYGKNGPFLRF